MGRLSVSALGRALLGGVLGFMALDGFRDMDESVEYAEANGVPMADRLVPLSHGMLLFGSLGVVLGRFPRLAAGSIATFFLGVTPLMHDFWNEEEPQQQLIHFLKNVALLGAAVFFLGRGPEEE